MQVAVIGAGGWGTALALLLILQGHTVRLWVRRSSFCEKMRRARENSTYLPGVPLPEQLLMTASLAEAVQEARLIVLAVPSHAMRSIAHALAPLIHGNPFIVSATKGIEEDSLLTMSAVLGETLGKSAESRIAVQLTAMRSRRQSRRCFHLPVSVCTPQPMS
jgi:glycerol-3-phosphate dehydrogenase (NAD(P)+)